MIFRAYLLPPEVLSLIRKILLPAPSPSSLTTRYFIPENLGVLETFAIRSLFSRILGLHSLAGTHRRVVLVSLLGVVRHPGTCGHGFQEFQHGRLLENLQQLDLEDQVGLGGDLLVVSVPIAQRIRHPDLASLAN